MQFPNPDQKKQPSDQQQNNQPEVLQNLATEVNDYLLEHIFPQLEPLFRKTRDIAVEFERKFKAQEHIDEMDLQNSVEEIITLKKLRVEYILKS